MNFSINFNKNEQIITAGVLSSAQETEKSEENIFDNSSFLEIDEEIGFTKQSSTKGDCWLLAGLNVLSYSDVGNEIIHNAITRKEDGSFEVFFKGVNKKVTLTEETLISAKQSGDYSTGDDDVLLLELAFENIIDEIRNGNVKVKGYHPYLTVNYKDDDEAKTALDGGSFNDVMFLLSNKDTHILTNKKKFDNVLNRIEKNNNYISSVLVFGNDNIHENEVIQDIYGNNIFKIPEEGSHAFSIKSVDGDNVIITNPHNSGEEYVVSRDTIKEYTKYMEFCIF
ncbi:hypothetical protein IJ182_03925 [bacterium]|nr:hypothetical protein [bacterium]